MWHPDEQVLYWCDIPGHKLHRFDPRIGASSAPGIRHRCGLLRSGAGRRPAARRCATVCGASIRPSDAARGSRAPPYDTADRALQRRQVRPAGPLLGAAPSTSRAMRRGPRCIARRSSAARAQGRRRHGLQRTGLESRRPHDVLDATPRRTRSTPSISIWKPAPWPIAACSRASSRKRRRPAPRRLRRSPRRRGGGCAGRYWVAMFEGSRLLRLRPRRRCCARSSCRCDARRCRASVARTSRRSTSPRRARSGRQESSKPSPGQDAYFR